ncbi:MAG: hypothetical protein NT047_10090, partial [Deltaproteobacteria bacterium]|nr:hypothetical protein [Deltaproteobacteria bacterium]
PDLPHTHDDNVPPGHNYPPSLGKNYSLTLGHFYFGDLGHSHFGGTEKFGTRVPINVIIIDFQMKSCRPGKLTARLTSGWRKSWMKYREDLPR